MSNGKDEKAKGPASEANRTGSGSDPKKPYATIDLTAKDVTPKSAAASASTGTSAQSSAPAAGATKSATGPAAASSASSTPSGTASAAAASAQPSAKSSSASTPPPAQKAASSGAGWFQTLVAGAVGGVLTLLGLGSLGLLGDQRGNEPLATRIAALEKSRASPTPVPADITAKLAAAEDRAKKAEEAAQAIRAQLASATKALEDKVAAQGPATQLAADKLARLDAQLAEIAAAAKDTPQAGRIPAIAQMTTRIGELDTALTTRTTAVRNELSQEIEKRLAKMGEVHEADRARLAQRAQSIEQTMKSVVDDTAALRTAVDGFKADLDTRFKGVAKPADVTSAIAPVTAKITALETSVANVVRSEADRNATAGNVLLSIELNNLKRALDRGGSYAAELAAVKRVAGGKLDLAVLESAQSSGVPGLPQLLAEFRPLAYKMLDAEAEPTDASIVDRMLAGAKSVVRVRKVDHAPDATGTEAVIGRMETALKEGRLADVVAESKKLTDKARAPAAGWLKKVDARLAIDKSIATIEASLKNALAGAPADAKKGTN